MTDPAIELNGVSKRYAQLHEEPMLLRSLMPFRRPQRTDLWALRDIDLTIQAGETVGLIGRNGAGKSTAMRLLAGVAQPSHGEVVVRGRIAPLLSVGVGFHGEMTGRENVIVNALLLGLSRDEIDARFEEIVAFAQLADFIDTPVKFYSSGMYMRLGFSVAIHVDPQVLLVDEVLAVGDIAFQLRCFERMRALQESGTTIVLVSHSMHAIRLLCPRAVVFAKGRLEYDGEVEGAIGAHHQLLTSADDQKQLYLHDRRPSGSVQVRGQELYDATGASTHVVSQDEITELRAELHFDADVESPQVLFVVRSEDATVVYRRASTLGEDTRPYLAGEQAELRIPFQARLGGGGTFTVEVVVTDRGGDTVIGRSPEPSTMYVSPRIGVFGVADLSASLLLDEQAIDTHRDLTLRSATRKTAVRKATVRKATPRKQPARKAAATPGKPRKPRS